MRCQARFSIIRPGREHGSPTGDLLQIAASIELSKHGEPADARQRAAIAERIRRLEMPIPSVGITFVFRVVPGARPSVKSGLMTVARLLPNWIG